MKSLITSSLIAALVLSTNTAFAGKRLSDSQLYTQCKTAAVEQLGKLKSSRLIKLKRRGQNFDATFRVKTAQDSGMYLCTIRPGQGVVVAKIDGQSSNVAKAN